MKIIIIFFISMLSIAAHAGVPSCEDYGRSEEDCYRSSGPFDEFIGGALLIAFGIYVVYKFFTSDSFRRGFIAYACFFIVTLGISFYLLKSYGKWAAMPFLLLIVFKMDWVLSQWYKLFGAFEEDKFPPEKSLSKINPPASQQRKVDLPPVKPAKELQQSASTKKPAFDKVEKRMAPFKCTSCNSYSPLNTWTESSAGESFKKCPKCGAHTQVEAHTQIDIVLEKSIKAEEVVEAGPVKMNLRDKNKDLKEYFDSLKVVCPNPTEWMALADIIGTNMGGHHANPLILAGWNFTDDEQKRNRVRHQIDYAETLGKAAFEKFEDYFRSIPKSGWYR